MIILTNESLRNVDKQLGVGHNISIKIFIFKSYLYFRLKAGESLHLGTVTLLRQLFINDQTKLCLPFLYPWINKITLFYLGMGRDSSDNNIAGVKSGVDQAIHFNVQRIS